MSPLGILFVVYTMRVYEQGRVINRTISVRPAKKQEIALYQSGKFRLSAGAER